MRKLLLGVIGLLCAVPSWATNLPAGYTQLEYIESTGTQYIDTGIVPANKKIGAVIDFQYTNTTGTTSGVFGSNSQDGVNNIQFTVFSSKWRYKINDFAAYGSEYDTNRHIVSLNMADGTKLDGNIVTNTQYTIPSTNTQNCFLGACNYNGTASHSSQVYILIGKIYSAKVYDDTTLVRDFVPAKNSSGVIGMYDTVSGQFFTNAGTGSFIAGPVVPETPIKIATTAYNTARFSPVVTELNDTIATIRSVVTNTINQTKAIADLQATKQTRPNETCPAGKKCLLVEDNDGQPHWYEIIENAYGLPNGYTALEYIENTDSQYINTGITVNSGTTVIATFQGTDDDKGAVFGYDQDYIGTMMQCYNGKWRVNNTTTDLPCTTKATVDITWTDDTSGRHVSTATINGITVPAYTNSRTYRTLMLFQGNGWNDVNNYWTGGKIYSLSITQNNTLVRNFVPAKRNSDNVLGMYDLTNDVFYTNAGTGTFTAGPEI